MVAVGLLAMVLSFAGVIFNVSIESHRMASANAEISQKLRAITDQLNADFGGIWADAPLLIWFEHEDPTDPEDDPNRYDQIMFFADGDFQSTQLYDGAPLEPRDTGTPIWGNTARVQYGQARVEIVGADKNPSPQDVSDPDELEPPERVLGRRQHILTLPPDATEPKRPKEWPAKNLGDFYSDSETYPYWPNDAYEHDSLSLAEWQTVDGSDYDDILEACFEDRPLVGLYDPYTYHNLMCEGVGSFAIQWAYWDDGEERFLWFPSDDPDGDGSTADSHFDLMGDDEFGVLFNVPAPAAIPSWEFIDDENVMYDSGEPFESTFFPKALKFTFRLYDSRGLIKEDGRKGRVFTHIVYLAD